LETDTPLDDTQVEDADGGGFTADQDCNDEDSGVNPDLEEICDGLYNDCDGLVDDADDPVGNKITWYQDLDGDGSGNPESAQEAWEQPVGHVDEHTDCNDADSTSTTVATDADLRQGAP
jgi:hypothetical protein